MEFFIVILSQFCRKKIQWKCNCVCVRAQFSRKYQCLPLSKHLLEYWMHCSHCINLERNKHIEKRCYVIVRGDWFLFFAFSNNIQYGNVWHEWTTIYPISLYVFSFQYNVFNSICIEEMLAPSIESKIFHVLHDFSRDLTSAAIHDSEWAWILSVNLSLPPSPIPHLSFKWMRFSIQFNSNTNIWLFTL